MYLYNLGIYIYQLLVNVFSIWNEKAGKMVSGRKNVFKKIKSFKAKFKTEKIIWFHAASLGEFEQGRPIIELIKKEFPNTKILLTFFSPSGYEIQKNYDKADLVCYLPFDNKRNAGEFVSILKPVLSVFIKYEFWLNYLNELNKNKIPTFLISGVFHKSQPFFKWYGSIFRKSLNYYEKIFVQDQKSAEYLKELRVKNFFVTGDTRFDRVIKIAKQNFHDEIIKNFSLNKKVIIAGSSYAEEEKMLVDFMTECKKNNFEVRLIMVPHEVNENSIQRIKKVLSIHHLSYSKYSEKKSEDVDVLIIDNIGMLSSIYRYGKLAVIGGGFSNGIHNLLEAAIYGIPVLFGPNHNKFSEAKGLIEYGAAFSFSNSDELKKNLYYFLKDETSYEKVCSLAKEFITSNSGATEKIFNQINFIL